MSGTEIINERAIPYDSYSVIQWSIVGRLSFHVKRIGLALDNPLALNECAPFLLHHVLSFCYMLVMALV